MSKTKLPGVDEFTSHRVRPRTTIGELSLVHEIRSVQSQDPIAVVEGAKGSRATDGEALSVVMYHRALVQSGLEHLGDFHQGMSAPEAENFLEQLGFKRVFHKQKRGPWTHQAWVDPITGIAVAGDFGDGRCGHIEMARPPRGSSHKSGAMGPCYTNGGILTSGLLRRCTRCYSSQAMLQRCKTR